MNNAVRHGVNRLWWVLRITYGILFVAAGLDKFFNLLVFWPQYISPFIYDLLPFAHNHVMLFIAIVEISIGLLILFNRTRLGAQLAAAWFFIIVVNLFVMGKFFDIAVRDIVLAIGALVLASLTTLHEKVARYQQ